MLTQAHLYSSYAILSYTVAWAFQRPSSQIKVALANFGNITTTSTESTAERVVETLPFLDIISIDIGIATAYHRAQNLQAWKALTTEQAT